MIKVSIFGASLLHSSRSPHSHMLRRPNSYKAWSENLGRECSRNPEPNEAEERPKKWKRGASDFPVTVELEDNTSDKENVSLKDLKHASYHCKYL